MDDIPFELTTKPKLSSKLKFGRGCMKGKMQMSKDFDTSINDFDEYMQ
jgi:hypothetical protein